MLGKSGAGTQCEEIPDTIATETFLVRTITLNLRYRLEDGRLIICNLCLQQKKIERGPDISMVR